MYRLIMNFKAQYPAVLILAALMTALASMCWWGFRHSKRPRLIGILGGYNLLLMTLLLFAVLTATDKDYGTSLVPFLIATLPGIVLVGPVLSGLHLHVVGGFLAAFAPALAACPNDILLYWVFRRIDSPQTSDGTERLLGGHSK